MKLHDVLVDPNQHLSHVTSRLDLRFESLQEWDLLVEVLVHVEQGAQGFAEVADNLSYQVNTA